MEGVKLFEDFKNIGYTSIWLQTAKCLELLGYQQSAEIVLAHLLSWNPKLEKAKELTMQDIARINKM